MVNLDLLKTTSPLLTKAYDFAKRAHEGQIKYGRPKIDHCVATAQNLSDWGFDDTTIAAGFLHDVVEDTKINLSEIKKEFGDDIKNLVDSVTRIKAIKYDVETAEAETLMKMFLAMTKDLRSVLIKLASRKDNLSALNNLSKDERMKIAKETIDIHAPLAYKLGMYKLSGELEDIAFAELYQSEYKWLLENVKERYDEREKYLLQIKPLVEELLKEGKINDFKIYFRAKRYASLWKKLLRYEMDLDKVYDLIAFRIVVNTIEDCYAVPGIIHKIWPPLPGRIKDYIALPKSNGYQSIHTTVLCDDQKAVEFQIKTKEMHEKAENGIAAQWAYEKSKESKDYIKRNSVLANEKDISFINQLRGWQKGMLEPEELVNSLKVNLFEDRVFAITPQGAVIDLPRGATPIDFAYKIHESVGNECVGAKVNGKIVPLDYKIRSEDIVEIIRQKNKKPSAPWLNFVVTQNAKNHIRKAMKGTLDLLMKHSPKKIEFRVTVINRIGIFKEISGVISRSHINITDINSANQSEKWGILKMKCELEDKEKAEKIIEKIKRIKGVKAADYRSV